MIVCYFSCAQLTLVLYFICTCLFYFCSFFLFFFSLYFFFSIFFFFFFSSRRRHTRYIGDWSSDVCSSDLMRLRRAARSALSSADFSISFLFRRDSLRLKCRRLSHATRERGRIFYFFVIDRKSVV